MYQCIILYYYVNNNYAIVINNNRYENVVSQSAIFFGTNIKWCILYTVYIIHHWNCVIECVI